MSYIALFNGLRASLDRERDPIVRKRLKRAIVALADVLLGDDS